MGTIFDATTMAKWISMSQYILSGLGITLSLYAFTIVLSMPLGMLGALGKVSSKKKSLSMMLDFYTWIFRGTPLMLQLFFFYFGLSTFGVRLTPFQAAVIAFVLNYSAYFIEIFRGGISSIDTGQYEAAHALGLNYWVTMVHVVIPQSLKSVLPSISNEAITLVKDTALVSAIGMGDLLRNSKEIVVREMIMSPFIIASIIYLILTSIVIGVFKRLENKYQY